MSLDVLAMMAVVLTLTMFVTRNALLGFPSAIMWAILGGYSYTLSVNDWDVPYLLFFASAFGMVIFTIFAAYSLREKRDTIADEDMEKGEGKFIDEGKGEEHSESDELEESQTGERTRRLRERAKKRRTGEKRRTRL